MKKKAVKKASKLPFQVFTCNAILEPWVKEFGESLTTSKPGKKKYGAVEISSLPFAPQKKTNGKKPKKK